MKKRLCVLLAMIMIICLLPMTVTATSTIWDGSIATAYAGGNGTELDPYQIANGQQLAYFARRVNSGTTYSDTYFYLVNDIALNNTMNWWSWSDTVAPDNEWTPIGNFSGTFNGGNHAISGIYVNTTGCAGLFGDAGYTSSTIKNLGVIDSFIKGGSYAGGIVGSSYSTIINCYNTGTVVGREAGGVCGWQDGNMTNCWNTGMVTGSSRAGGIAASTSGIPDYQLCYNGGAISVSDTDGYAGGIIAFSYSGEDIINCYNSGPVAAPQGYAGGIAGYCFSVQNCYNSGEIFGAADKTGLISARANAFDFTISGTYYLEDGTSLRAVGEYYDSSANPPTTYNQDVTGTASLTFDEMQVQSSFVGWDFTDIWTMAGDVNYSFPELLNMPIMSVPDHSIQVWDGTIVSPYAGGIGIELDPYQIANGQQLAYLAQQVNAGTSYSGTFFTLIDDIMLNDTTTWQAWSDTIAPDNSWTPIGTSNSNSFAGTLDGGNHTISGIYINSTADYVGLFGHIDSTSTIRNLGVIDSFISNSGSAGAIVGLNDGSILNCCNKGTVDGSSAGGIAGSNNAVINGCINMGKVVSDYEVGGIAGNNSDEVSNCINLGTVGADDYLPFSAGGLVGTNGGVVTRCFNEANVIGGQGSLQVGGVVGGNDGGTIQDCYNSGMVTRGHGISGVNYSSEPDDISRCYNVGALDSGYAGICGTYSGHETYCYYLDTTATTGFTGRADATGVCESLTDAQMQVQDSFVGFDFPDVWTMVGYVAYLYPELQNMPILFDPNPNPNLDPEADLWDGTSATDFECGTGSELDPYLIMTCEQLAYFRDQVNGGRSFSGEYVRVGANLLLNQTTAWRSWSDTNGPEYLWTPIGRDSHFTFDGTFDCNNYAYGGNYIIGGIYLVASDQYAGLFGQTGSNSTIKNVGTINSYIHSTHESGYSGVIAGLSNGYIFNSFNTGDTVGFTAGGICGYQNGSVSNCWNIGSIRASQRAGGIAGYAAPESSSFELCCNKGLVDVSGVHGEAGGIVGCGSTISNCYNYGTITAQVGYSGGIVGNLTSSLIQKSYNAGIVDGAENGTGSIAGKSSYYSSFSNVYFLDEITPPNAVGTYYEGSERDALSYVPEGAILLDDGQMRVADNFTGFDFIDDWTMEGDAFYPFPKIKNLPFLTASIVQPDPPTFTLPIMTRGGAARYDRTGIRFGASVSFVDLTVMNVGDTIDYGFNLNGLRNDALTSANWIRLSAASAAEGFTGFTWTAEMEAATTAEELAAVIRSTGIKVYEYDPYSITFAVILLNMPLAAQDSLWVFEPYVTINANTSLGEIRYTSVNRILTDVPSSVFAPEVGGTEQ